MSAKAAVAIVSMKQACGMDSSKKQGCIHTLLGGLHDLGDIDKKYPAFCPKLRWFGIPVGHFLCRPASRFPVLGVYHREQHFLK